MRRDNLHYSHAEMLATLFEDEAEESDSDTEPLPPAAPTGPPTATVWVAGNAAANQPDAGPSRTWAFTLNNPTELEWNTLRALTVSYRVLGKEVSASGTPHIQGWLVFKRTYRRRQLKDTINARAHWEIGKAVDGENYCLKGGDFELTNNRNQGKRSDLDAVWDTIKTGARINEIIEKHPSAYIKYPNGIQKVVLAMAKPRAFEPEITVYWGKTGVGKTRWVIDNEPDLYKVNHGGHWWDGYNNNEAVLLDDYRGDWMKLHELLTLIDRYPINVEVKGAYVTFNSKRIYFTSDRDPKDWYPSASAEEYSQLERRIKAIIEVELSTVAGPPPPKRRKMIDGVLQEELLEPATPPAAVNFFNL